MTEPIQNSSADQSRNPENPQPAPDPLLIAAARWYAGRGLHPIRLRLRDKIPAEKDWESDPLNLATLEQSLRAAPQSGIGLRMGLQPDGTARVALDVDDWEGAKGLEAQLGELPQTLTSQTSKGAHLVFQVQPEALNDLVNFTKRSGIDLRTEGGQIAVQPSIHPSGWQYRWANPQASIAPLPAVGESVLAPRPKRAKPARKTVAKKRPQKR